MWPIIKLFCVKSFISKIYFKYARHLETRTVRDGQLETGTVREYFSLGYSQEIFLKVMGLSYRNVLV